MIGRPITTALTTALALALAVAAATAGVQTLRLQSLRAEVAQQRAGQAEADRLHDRVATRRNQEIDRATQTALETDRRAAAATGGDVARLRDALIAAAQARAAAPISCADDRAAVDRLESLLGACAAVVADGLERGDAIARQVTGLQALGSPLPGGE